MPDLSLTKIVLFCSWRAIVWCFVMRTLVLHLVFVLFACNYLDAYHLIRPARRHGRPGPSLTQSRFIIDKTFGFMLSYYYRYRSPLCSLAIIFLVAHTPPTHWLRGGPYFDNWYNYFIVDPRIFRATRRGFLNNTSNINICFCLLFFICIYFFFFWLRRAGFTKFSGCPHIILLLCQSMEVCRERLCLSRVCPAFISRRYLHYPYYRDVVSSN